MKRLKLLLLVGLVGLLSVGEGMAQGGFKAFPGQTLHFSWSYNVVDEPNTTGFRIYSAPAATGPFTFTGITVTPASARSTTSPAAFQSGNVFVFYTTRAFFSTTQGIVESIDSNDVEVDLNVHTPTGLQVN